MGLSIRNDSCELDLLALGALVHRLDPGIVPFREARQFDIHVSGGEYNVAANLAACFGKRTGIATAMVDNGIGELIQRRVAAMGVRPFYKHFVHDGVRGPNMATVYSDRGCGVRPPIVFYNRAMEAAGLLQPGDFDWPAICAGGLRWFHSGGIFASLSESTALVVMEAIQNAKAMGAIVSFDLNYRGKLWATMGGEQKGQGVMREIVRHVDVLIGNEEDMQLSLGIPGPALDGEVAAGAYDPSGFLRMIDQVREQFPQIEAVATTVRHVHTTNRHDWSAVLWMNGESWVAPTCALDVHDRIGGGDGFASGLIFGLLDGRSPEQALRLGWAHGALLTTYPGDVSMASLAEVQSLADGGSARVRR